MEYDQIDKSLDDLRRQHEARTRELKQQRRKHQERLEEIKRLERIKDRQLHELEEEANFLEGVEPETKTVPSSSPAPQDEVEETATQPQQRTEEAETVDQPSVVEEREETSRGLRAFIPQLPQSMTAIAVVAALVFGLVGVVLYDAFVIDRMDNVGWADSGWLTFSIFFLMGFATYQVVRSFEDSNPNQQR